MAVGWLVGNLRDTARVAGMRVVGDAALVRARRGRMAGCGLEVGALAVWVAWVLGVYPSRYSFRPQARFYQKRAWGTRAVGFQARV